jgi:hypothetical protein
MSYMLWSTKRCSIAYDYKCVVAADESSADVPSTGYAALECLILMRDRYQVDVARRHEGIWDSFENHLPFLLQNAGVRRGQ